MSKKSKTWGREVNDFRNNLCTTVQYWKRISERQASCKLGEKKQEICISWLCVSGNYEKITNYVEHLPMEDVPQLYSIPLKCKKKQEEFKSNVNITLTTYSYYKINACLIFLKLKIQTNKQKNITTPHDVFNSQRSWWCWYGSSLALLSMHKNVFFFRYST